MNFIGVHRMGGLGNQLFQYAAACAVASRHPGSQIILDTERDNIHNLKGYEYSGKVFDAKMDSEKYNSIENEFHQGEFSDPWDVDSVKPPIRMHGYFQYLPPLLPIIPHLRWMIQRNLKSQQSIMRERFPSFEPTQSVFLHVRHGDYLLHPDYHFIQSLDYYKQAYRLIDTPEDKTIYIVSDDNDWVRRQAWGFSYTLIEEDDELLVFAFMSMCKGGAIIANSSFSWWGAMMAEPYQVFYPQRWVNASISNLFPPHWICVETIL
jgi:hypothetical protein